MMLKKFTNVILALILSAIPAYAAFEQIKDFDENSLPILNENFRQLFDRTYEVKYSSDDSSPGYLDGRILYITVLGEIVDGTVAGWAISDTSFSSGSGATTVGLDSGGVNPAIYCGSATPASAPFRVTNAGAVTATSGSIGGWTLSTDRLSYGTDSDYIGLLPGTGIQIGDSTFNDAEFSVTNAGVLKATSGTIGGWDLTSDTIESSSDNIVLNDSSALITVGATGGTHLQIDGANTRIRSSDYVSGALGSGWQIDSTVAEFNNIRARGKLTTTVLEYAALSVIGGNFLISHDADVLNADMTAISTDLITEGDVQFAVDDILWLDDGTNSEYMTVATAPSITTYTVTRASGGAAAAWKKGTAIANLGQSGDGAIYMSASETNAPYLDVITHEGAPWTTLTTRARLGNLNGYLDYSTDLYGIAIGETDAYLKYDPTNGLRIKGTITVNSGELDIEELDSYTKLLLHCNGADTSTTYIDETGKTATANGDAQMDTAQKVFGTGSALFDGTGDYLSLADSDDWYFGTGNFTVDFWVKWNDVSAEQVFISQYQDNGNQWWITKESPNYRVKIFCDFAGVDVSYSSDILPLENDVWYHFAFIRNGTSLLFFVNGTEIPWWYIGSSIETKELKNITGNLNIGRRSAYNDRYFNGHLDEFRISKGIARWTADFSVPIGPYSDDSLTTVGNWRSGTDQTYIDGGNIYTGTITADKITAGTYVGGNFVIGEGGAFQSANYVSDTSGFSLNYDGLELNEGTIQGEGILETVMIYAMLFGERGGAGR